jgi:cytoskeleton protein RodZ
MTENDAANAETETVPAGDIERLEPGQRLREAREEAGLSLEDVSARLHLRVELLHALEEGDYENLPPIPFVNGYRRSYARLLDIRLNEESDDSELHGANREKGAVSSAVSGGIAPIMPRKELRSSDWPVKLLTWIIILLLLALLAAWWFARQPGEGGFFAQISEMAAATPEEEISPAIPSLSAAASRSTDDTEQALADDHQVVEQEAFDAPAPIVQPEPEPIEDAAVEIRAASIEITAESGDSWLEIRDADDRQLAYELLQAGARRLLQGKAPFKVFFGNAPAVSVRYQGKPFDHAPYRNQDTAKFTLGTDADNQPVTD